MKMQTTTSTAKPSRSTQLTLFCFLILYLFSHTPSRSDLTHFARFSKHFVPATEMDHMEVKRGDILAIRSLRNLQESLKSRPHRKFAHF